MSKIELSIIIPVKNEKDNIEWIVKKIYALKNISYEVLIVYDDEKDDTLPVAKKLSKKYPRIKIYKNRYHPGVINAVKTGFEKSRGDTLVMMACDRTDDPRAIKVMYQKIKEDYDLVCPTRYSKGGRVIGKTTVKSLLSRVAGVSTPYILGIPTSDLTYSYKMFKKKILKKIYIESHGGFEFAEEILVKAHIAGYKIIEVPVVWRDRKYGKSKFLLLKWLPGYLHWYFYALGKRFR